MVESTQYGFRWGPALIERAIHMTSGAYKGYRSLYVITDAGQQLQISISPKGNSLRVWRNGKELT